MASALEDCEKTLGGATLGPGAHAASGDVWCMINEMMNEMPKYKKKKIKKKKQINTINNFLVVVVSIITCVF